jgi:hypothetical protein
MRSRILLCAAHVVGNASLLLLGYYWLGLGESDAAHLALSAAVIVFFALAAVWLHGTAFVLFRRSENQMFARAARLALRNLVPLFLLGVVVLCLYLALWHFYYSFGHEAFNIGSYSTMKLRRPVAPNNVLKAFQAFIWFLRWFVVPVLAFPLASEIAQKGWSGYSLAPFKRSKKVLYWLEAGLLTVAAVLVPLYLVLWIPTMSSFSMQVFSVVARFGLGYLMFTGGLLALEFVTSAGSPPVTQLSTAVSP